MPELPEIEHLRRSLAPVLLGTTVARIRLDRPDIIRPARGRSGRERVGHEPSSAATAARLLRGEKIVAIERRGKELALVSGAGSVVGVHLGMSGQLLVVDAGRRLVDRRHVHCTWWLNGAERCRRLVFRDPRRFGGLWLISSHDHLVNQHWALLGPDALTVGLREFSARLRAPRRAVKTALLDQRVVAGVGNIYADEALHGAGVHPLTPACELDDDQVRLLCRVIRSVLRRAIRAGGSTIRDYRDGSGEPGRFAGRHQVYGRSGQPCTTCGTTLERLVICQRSSTYCPICQPLICPQGVNTPPTALHHKPVVSVGASS